MPRASVLQLGCALILVTGLFLACSDGGASGPRAHDASTRDASTHDASTSNASTRDASASDASTSAAADGAELPSTRCDPDAGGASGRVDELDLLLVIDNSITMIEEQVALADQLPYLLELLTPADGPTKLHVGVVSTDLGLALAAGGDVIQGCSGRGDDSVLQHFSTSDAEECSDAFPTFLEYDTARDTPSGAARKLACVLRVGTDGCGFGQPLESALGALWPASATPAELAGGTPQGRGDGENAGFFATGGDSALAVIVLSNDDDCSHPDAGFLTPAVLLDPNDPDAARLRDQGLSTRCRRNPQALFKLARYVEGLRALVSDPTRVFFSAIVGVPAESVFVNTDFDVAAARDRFYDNILDNPKMKLAFDDRGTDDPVDDAIVPSCSGSVGLAFPPNRMVELARSFGPHGIVQSICQPTLAPAVEAIAARIHDHLANPCL